VCLHVVHPLQDAEVHRPTVECHYARNAAHPPSAPGLDDQEARSTQA
jgi:hypothetical protein